MKQDFEATIGLDVVSVGVGNKVRTTGGNTVLFVEKHSP